MGTAWERGWRIIGPHRTDSRGKNEVSEVRRLSCVQRTNWSDLILLLEGRGWQDFNFALVFIIKLCFIHWSILSSLYLFKENLSIDWILFSTAELNQQPKINKKHCFFRCCTIVRLIYWQYYGWCKYWILQWIFLKRLLVFNLYQASRLSFVVDGICFLNEDFLANRLCGLEDTRDPLATQVLFFVLF